MIPHEDAINELALLCGILNEYWDVSGQRHITAIETKKAMLRAMKLNPDSDEELHLEIEKRRLGPWKRMTEPVKVISIKAQPGIFEVFIPLPEEKEDGLEIFWSVEDEKGRKKRHTISRRAVQVAEQKWIEGKRYVKVFLSEKAARPIGYYKIHIECRHSDKVFGGTSNVMKKSAVLIVTPDECYMPQGLSAGRSWGISANLYSIRSSVNWGIGDFGDLSRIISHVSSLGGDFIGINPLHAIANTKPFGMSPYSPISRLYRNFIYLHIEGVPEARHSQKARTLLSSPSFQKRLDELRSRVHIDYQEIADLKTRVLKHCFAFFYDNHYTLNTDRASAFRKYISEDPAASESFALFISLWRHFIRSRHVYSWQEWPPEYHDPSGKAVASFRKKHTREILFHLYVQWLVDCQLKKASDTCRKLGMKVGLYHDLAIGSVAGGSDIWEQQDIAASADVGAPPDDFNPNGQNWGFPPLIPERIRENKYSLFINTIRKNMKYGGALRIDHALGLFRLFWIPAGLSPKDGAYISQPADDLLRIIALESVRNKTMVIAEDLGTIEEGFREKLQGFRMLSYRLFYFERNYPSSDFRRPEAYPRMSLCAVTTHDLPTLYGYWAGRDIETKKRIGIYSSEEQWKADLAARERDKALIISAMKEQGFITWDFPSDLSQVPRMTPDLCKAVYRHLARTPCTLVLVSLDDIIGTIDQQNMPGTVDTYPNWIQKTPLTLAEIIADKRLSALAEIF